MEENRKFILNLINILNIIKESVINQNINEIKNQDDLFDIIKKFNSLMMIESINNKSYCEFIEKINNKLSLTEINKYELKKQVILDWIYSYENIIAVNLISKMNLEMDLDTRNIIISFYDNANLDNELKSAAYFAISEMLKDSNVKLAYEYGIKAFQLYPEASRFCGVEKTFDICNIENNYYERCPICNSIDVKPYKKINQFYEVREQKCFLPIKMWMKCNSCTNLFAYNFPVTEMKNINGHYTQNCEENYITPRLTLSVYSNIFNKCNKYTDGNKYLEIGVGNGEMLATALEFGYDVSAIEICKEDCEKISSVLNIDIMWADFLNAELDEKYDIIIMGDVLEHISRPYAALQKAKDLLNDNGVLWVSTPNYESGFSRMMKDKDPMWNQLNHFTYFSYKGIVNILDKIGLKVVRYDVSDRYNGSMELYVKKYID